MLRRLMFTSGLDAHSWTRALKWLRGAGALLYFTTGATLLLLPLLLEIGSA